jgi:hypothetical protein
LERMELELSNIEFVPKSDLAVIDLAVHVHD